MRGQERRRSGKDFYPRPPRGGRLLGVVHVFAKIGISIHALREEGDVLSHCPLADLAISIHALREEGDAYRGDGMMLASNFYPRPPRGGRPAGGGYLLHVHGISIHALREEGDSPILTGVGMPV